MAQPVTNGFPSQRASNPDRFSTPLRHHVWKCCCSSHFHYNTCAHKRPHRSWRRKHTGLCLTSLKYNPMLYRLITGHAITTHKIRIHPFTPPLHCQTQTRCNTTMIQGLRPANERQRYFVTTSLIGWTQALNPWLTYQVYYHSSDRLGFRRLPSL